MAAKKSLVTLNIGSQRVTMGVFSPGAKGALLLRKYDTSELLPDPAADATRTAQIRAAVDELAGKLGVKKGLLRYAVSGRSSFMRFVKLPPLGEEKVDQIVEFEAQQNVPFPIDEVIWDYQLVGEDKTSEVEVVIVAVKSEVLDELNEAVEASVTTDSVDAAPMALYNAFRFNYSDVQHPALLVDIGARSTNLIYIDGNHVFTRNTTGVGGATITSSIAKEFGLEFADAEMRKVQNGLVSLGGAYQDHPDAEVAAMSKVIRNSLTRLHADIVRTTNQYRGQQGGSAPQRVYLAGGCASLPYIAEFFEEKLKLPVEFFNSLRNVGVGDGVNMELASQESHRLGEVVGLALRGAGVCPMEIDLIPSAVKRARDVKSRKPFLITAAAVAFSLLGAGIIHFNRASALVESELGDLEKERRELQGWDGKISEQRKILQTNQNRSAALERAVFDRTYWLQIFDEMNNLLPKDLVWVTQFEPMSGGVSVSGKMKAGRNQRGFNNEPDFREDSEGEDGGREGMIDALLISGLYRDQDGGRDDVSEFLDKLAGSEHFDLKDLGDERTKYLTNISTGSDKWAYAFRLHLPLKRAIQYK